MINKDPENIKNMFNEISSYYDEMNNLISLGTHKIIKFLALKNLNIKANTMILDLCCGTGDFTRIITKIQPKARVIGIDNSEKMLKLARIKNPKKAFNIGDCTKLSFKDEEFDYITIGFGLRNIQDRSKAIDEIYRTLKKGGKFLHLDFGKHNFVSNIFGFLVSLIAKFKNVNAQSYQYLLNSKEIYPEPNELISEFCEHGFKFVKRMDFMFGVISAQIMIK